eukprot:CAMPEP_0115152562 /NCGR_PEP_ID=MMETSP0227-20121206/66226_1 /TAXON_ID=89957 /ORGANISM="Polarella glacialis, Strain CCMP 1383" /LENGTH=133 /DNA_ID=CAMNT_0002563177 /DNA_START=101 /DNA_END=499 /DNA_ORIENTATION=+
MDMIAAGSYGFTGMLMDFFGYNRKNFMNDRRQRQVMEYQLVESKIIQSDLWRDDVREAIELTPKKMEVYLLVIALELTGAATCLCKTCFRQRAVHLHGDYVSLARSLVRSARLRGLTGLQGPNPDAAREVANP